MVDCVGAVNFIGEVVEWRQSVPGEPNYPFTWIVQFKNGDKRLLQRGDAFLVNDMTYIFDGHKAQVIGSSVAMISEPENVTIADKIPTNCKNCGAPLGGRHSCRYCETWN